MADPGGTFRRRGAALPLVDVEDGVTDRLASHIEEFDRVLGGGLVAGSLVLLGGEPGIGKSTLLLQTMDIFARQGPVLYVSGEESQEQAASRGKRLGIESRNLFLVPETRLSTILELAARLKPKVLVVDSIQTLHDPSRPGLPGGTRQINEAAARLLAFAKESGVAVLAAAHVTKEGILAGPKTLEHMVDVVLKFEGERTSGCRLLRAEKNRFGPTTEIGVFEMTAAGLKEVPNPSAMLLKERDAQAPGSAVAAALKGTRPLLVEIQALLCLPTGRPRRAAVGVDPARVAMLLAMLEGRLGLSLVYFDVFVNAVGGIRLDEPATDLPLAMALVSIACGRPLDPQAVCFGEVGLSGEVRSVPGTDLRIAEAARLGFTRCVLPAASCADRKGPSSIELVPVSTISAAILALMCPPDTPPSNEDTAASWASASLAHLGCPDRRPKHQPTGPPLLRPPKDRAAFEGGSTDRPPHGTCPQAPSRIPRARCRGQGPA